MKNSESGILSVTTSLLFTWSWLSLYSFLSWVSVRGGNMALGHSDLGLRKVGGSQSLPCLFIFIHPLFFLFLCIFGHKCVRMCVCGVVVVVSYPKAFLERVVEQNTMHKKDKAWSQPYSTSLIGEKERDTPRNAKSSGRWSRQSSQEESLKPARTFAE